MKKERINEIKKGLENDIYSKIKDIEVEKREEVSRFSPNYESTDFLADILPPKEEANDTIQILDKNSVDLELDRDALLQKYDEYIYNEPEIIHEKTLTKEENVKDDIFVDDLIKEEFKTEDSSSYKKHEFQENEPNIPRFETEEHLEQISKDIEDVELKYKEEERKKLEEISQKISLQEKNKQEIFSPIQEDEKLNEQFSDDQTMIAPKTSYEEVRESIPVENIEFNQMNEVEEEMDLANDFLKEDQIVIPDDEDIIQKPSSPIEDSQFIFEQDIEDEEPVLENYSKENTKIVDAAQESYDDTVAFETSPIFVEKQEEDYVDEIDSFWEEEEVEERKYVDIILFIILIILILIIVYMIF